MNTPRTHKESIDVARIGAAEIAAHRDGISLKGPMIWALRQAGQMTPAKAMTPGTLAWNGGRDYVLAGYASARAFGWIASADNDASDADRRRPRLRAPAAHGDGTGRGPATAQPDPAGISRDGRAARGHAQETGIAAGATLQMFFRLGYAGDPGPSPRRALTSFMTA